MTTDFNPHTENITLVYDADNNEIDRLPGLVTIHGNDYKDRLPISYHHVSVTTQILNVIRIDPKPAE
jgi:hypothetical protein